MRNALRWLHLLAGGTFMGAVAAALLIAARADTMSPTAFASSRELINFVGSYLALPSLTVLIVSGMLLVAAHPIWMEARWVWAKAFLGALVSALFLFLVQPAFRRAAALASGALGSAPSFDDLQSAIQTGATYGAAVLVIALVASTIAVWKPRLGAREPGSSVNPTDRADPL
ncbi:MAG: DUF2269 family protein [Burkholderiaceae bacterium]